MSDFLKKFGLHFELTPKPLPPPPVERRVIPFRCSIQGAHCLMGVERIPGQDHFSITEIIEVSMSSARKAAVSGQSGKLSLSLIDTSNFSCPSCRRLGNVPAIDCQFVHCGRCDEIICAGRTVFETNSKGRRVMVFRCHLICGEVGVMGPPGPVEANSMALAPGALPASAHITHEPGDLLRLAAPRKR